MAANVTIREATPSDRDSVLALFRDGKLGEQADPADPSDDIDRFETTYLGGDGSGLWIAELEGFGPVGMVGVLLNGDHRAELRRLRVHHDHRNKGIGTKLVSHALQFCRERAYLKVALDTYLDRRPAIALFEKFGFRFAQSREAGARTLQEFYLDLYQDPSN